MTLGVLPWFGLAYLLGAIPTSYLVARLVRGVDLRTVGSGNLGATNLYRQMGWRWAIPVAVFDLLKGMVPVVLFARWAGVGGVPAVLLGVMAMLGHVYSVFVGFKGGKGVATGAGIVLGVAPWAFLASLVAWGLVVRASGYVSLGSIVGAIVFPIAAWFAHPAQRGLAWLHLLLALAIIVLHRANIQRLLRGTENRFGQQPRPAGETTP
ncbi:MAG: glycerol-3-phosphate 1-O-acyltransferase PlsY [Gemmatimonadota bacterium]|nr:glycerol-3-phosphate 1-O-acyltransferase PlsY [Gemmatimonadota bacterium]